MVMLYLRLKQVIPFVVDMRRSTYIACMINHHRYQNVVFCLNKLSLDNNILLICLD